MSYAKCINGMMNEKKKRAITSRQVYSIISDMVTIFMSLKWLFKKDWKKQLTNFSWGLSKDASKILS